MISAVARAGRKNVFVRTGRHFRLRPCCVKIVQWSMVPYRLGCALFQRDCEIRQAEGPGDHCVRSWWRRCLHIGKCSFACRYGIPDVIPIDFAIVRTVFVTGLEDFKTEGVVVVVVVITLSERNTILGAEWQRSSFQMIFDKN